MDDWVKVMDEDHALDRLGLSEDSVFVAEERADYVLAPGPGDDIAIRLLRFGARVISLVRKLPADVMCRHIGGQLLRAGTSPGAHYEEARGSESRADFVHKMGVGLKELKESRYWIRLLVESKLVSVEDASSLLKECQELIAITAKSIMTAKRGK